MAENDQKCFRKLEILRKTVNWKINEDRRKLLRQLYPLIRHWKGQLPNLREFFREEEIDWILIEAVQSVKASDYNKDLAPLIDFVIRTGYKNEPKLGTDGKPLLHRTTALHHVAKRCRTNRDDLVGDLFKIYDRFDVNYVDETGFTHFHVACKSGCYEAAQQFLDLGQDPNCLVSKSGNSPLHLALIDSHKKVAELLLNYGADPNLANKSGSTPLHVICSNKNQDDDFMNNFFKINAKKNQPVKIDAQDKQGRTPLFCALNHDLKNIFESLLRKGANPNLADIKGSTCLHVICKSNYYCNDYCNDYNFAKTFFSICDEMHQTVQVDSRDHKGKSPLHLALLRRCRNLVELLLRRGSDPNLADEDRLTPLHYTSDRFRDVNFVEMLFDISDELNQLVEVDARDKFGNTPLHLAVKDIQNKKKIEILLRRGTSPNLANEDGLTPLHIICRNYWNDDLAKIFFDINDELNQRVQVDAKDKSGQTPLQLAVANLMPNTVGVLLDHGADLSSFVFLLEKYLDEKFNVQSSDNDSCRFQKLRLTSGVLAVVESLEKGGYELYQSDALTIMKLFSKYGLFGKSVEVDKCWLKDKKFATNAKKIMMKPNLSLYGLIQLRPEEAAKSLTYEEYLKFGYSMYHSELNRTYWEACFIQLNEKIYRRFIRRWAVEFFLQLTSYRLPILCCGIIIKQDVGRICLAFIDQSL